MNRYRLSKYNPCFRNLKGAYLKNDWTAFSDIGKCFDDKVLTLNEYLVTENAYLEVIMSILHRLGVNNMRIKDLEKESPPQLLKKLKEKGMGVTDGQYRLMSCLKNNNSISINRLKDFFRLQLRELFWCRWEDNKSNVLVDFGYDYYVYIICENIPDDLVEKAVDYGIYVELMASTFKEHTDLNEYTGDGSEST